MLYLMDVGLEFSGHIVDLEGVERLAEALGGLAPDSVDVGGILAQGLETVADGTDTLEGDHETEDLVGSLLLFFFLFFLF